MWRSVPSWISTNMNSTTWMKQAPLEMIVDMGLTTVQYNDAPNFSKDLHDKAKSEGIPLKWSTAYGPKAAHTSSVYMDGSDGKTGLPTDEEWEGEFLTEAMGSKYLKDLVSVCIGDEEDYSDTLTQNLKSWFEFYREKYDNAEGRTSNILLHHNEVGNVPRDNMRQISTLQQKHAAQVCTDSQA